MDFDAVTTLDGRDTGGGGWKCLDNEVLIIEYPAVQPLPRDYHALCVPLRGCHVKRGVRTVIVNLGEILLEQTIDFFKRPNCQVLGVYHLCHLPQVGASDLGVAGQIVEEL